MKTSEKDKVEKENNTKEVEENKEDGRESDGSDIEDTATCWQECIPNCVRFSVSMFFLLVPVLLIMDDNQAIMTDHIRMLTPTPPWDFSDVDVTFCPYPSINPFRFVDIGNNMRQIFEGIERNYFMEANNKIEEIVQGQQRHGKIFSDLMDVLRKAEENNIFTGINITELIETVRTSDDFYYFLRDKFGKRADTSAIYEYVTVLANDNATLVDAFQRLSINATDYLNIRQPHWEKHAITWKSLPSRLGMKCTQYKVPLRSRHSPQFRRLIFDFKKPNCSLIDEQGILRRESYCPTMANMQMKVSVTGTGEFSDISVLQDYTPISIAMNRNSFIVSRPRRLRHKLNNCQNKLGEHKRCVKKKIAKKLIDTLPCYIPWVYDIIESSTYVNENVSLCRATTHTKHAARMAIDFLDGRTSSDLQSECKQDCTKLSFSNLLLGSSGLEANRDSGQLTILIDSEAQLYSVSFLTYWSMRAVYISCLVYFCIGISLLSGKRWLVEFSLWVGGSRKYLPAAIPLTIHQLQVRRMLWRLKKQLQRKRWWLPNPKRPWLKPVEWSPLNWVQRRIWLLHHIRYSDFWRIEHLKILDCSSSDTSDTETHSDGDLPKKITFAEITRVILCPFGYESSTDSDIPEFDDTLDWADAIRDSKRKKERAMAKRARARRKQMNEENRPLLDNSMLELEHRGSSRPNRRRRYSNMTPTDHARYGRSKRHGTSISSQSSDRDPPRQSIVNRKGIDQLTVPLDSAV